jgi:hypothetical protein
MRGNTTMLEDTDGPEQRTDLLDEEHRPSGPDLGTADADVQDQPPGEADPQPYVPAQPGGRPSMPRGAAIGYDWFQANGVEEWVPEVFGPVVVDVAAGTLTYTSFVFQDGRRGWDTGLQVFDETLGQLVTERRTVPLMALPDDEVLAEIAREAQAVADRITDRLSSQLSRATEKASWTWPHDRIEEATRDVAGQLRNVAVAMRMIRNPVEVIGAPDTQPTATGDGEDEEAEASPQDSQGSGVEGESGTAGVQAASAPARAAR